MLYLIFSFPRSVNERQSAALSLAEIWERKWNWERSVLTLGSQIPSASPATYWTQKLRQLKIIPILSVSAITINYLYTSMYL